MNHDTFSGKPGLLVSSCLLGNCCKYNGGHNLCPEVTALAEHFSLIPFCPEQAGGLPTPRTPAERRGIQVLTQDGRDVTEHYRLGAELALRATLEHDLHIAVLKARSPSCGCGMIYDGSFSGTQVPGYGVTAELLLQHGITVYTEETLPEEIPV